MNIPKIADDKLRARAGAGGAAGYQIDSAERPAFL